MVPEDCARSGAARGSGDASRAYLDLFGAFQTAPNEVSPGVSFKVFYVWEITVYTQVGISARDPCARDRGDGLSCR